MKECAGNDRIKYYEDKGIACWSGNDDESFLGRHECRSHGVISVTSNIVPRLMRQLMDDCSQSTLNESLQPLMNWLFCEPNPIAINTALMMTGAVEPVFRLPYQALTQAQQAQGLEILSEIAQENRVGKSLAMLEDKQFIYTA